MLKGHEVQSWMEDLLAKRAKDPNGYIVLTLWMLDHSGLTVRIGGDGPDVGNPFPEDPGGWDSGRIGVIYVDRERLEAEYGKLITAPKRAKAEEVLRAEVDEYSRWLSGDCWGYVIERPDGSQTDDGWEEVDSCWGFIGFDDARQVATEAADHLADVRSGLRSLVEHRLGKQGD